MFENRGFAAERPARLATPVTIILLALNVAVFAFQYYLLPRMAPSWVDYRFTETFALSLDGLRAGHLWQLVTYQFLHGSPLHIFANSWAIFIFGRVVEARMGAWRMLVIYLLSGIAGGLVQMLGSGLWPGLFGDEPIIGASASAYGLVAAFVTLFPSQRLLMLLFFILPISMRARTLLKLSVWFSLLGILYPIFVPRVHKYLPFPARIDSMFLGIGHAAHLGGMGAGLLLTLWLRRGMRLRPVVEIPPKSPLNVTAAPD